MVIVRKNCLPTLLRAFRADFVAPPPAGGKSQKRKNGFN
jgi:hypothetical protein